MNFAQNNISTIPYSIFFLIILFTSCNNVTPEDLYLAMRENVRGMISFSGKGTASKLGRFGAIAVSAHDFSYIDSSGRNINYKHLEQLSAGARKLMIKKLLLRRMIVESGLKENIFNTPEAAVYIMPQLEKILEEYYFYEKGNYKGIIQTTARFDPGNEVFIKYMKKKIVKKSSQSRESLIREKNNIVKSIARRRMYKKRLKIINELLKKNPRMEIYK